MTFTIRRGTNISHWLSQSTRRGAERAAYFTRADVEKLAGLGLDHLRIPIDEEQMWDDSGQPHEDAFALLNSALDWCADSGLRAVVDLHILRAHHFLDKNPPLYTDPAEQARFAGLWEQLSDRLRDRPLDMVAYELLNEAVAHDPEDWNTVAHRAYDTVRAREPERVIVLGSNNFNSVHTYGDLDIPEDRNLILTFHYYNPMLVTHYRAHWTPVGAYKGPVHYPGLPIAEEDLAAVTDEALRGALARVNVPFGRAEMEAELALPLAARQRTGNPLYCGEFGCYHMLPQDLRIAWYRDFIDVLNAHDIAWANWDYKGDFGLFTPDGPDQEVIDILLGE